MVAPWQAPGAGGGKGGGLAAAPPSVRPQGQVGLSEAWELPEILLDDHPREFTLGGGTQLSAEGHANRALGNQGGEKPQCHKGKTGMGKDGPEQPGP